MTIESDFLELMTDEVVWEASNGIRDGYGGVGYGTATTLTCRLVRQNKMVRLDTGDEAVSRSHAYVYGAPGIQPEDRITLADSSTPDILQVVQYPDENGAHHEIVYFAGSG